MALRGVHDAQLVLHRHGYEPVRADAAGVPPVERVENPWHVPQVHDRKPLGRRTVVDASDRAFTGC